MQALFIRRRWLLSGLILGILAVGLARPVDAQYTYGSSRERGEGGKGDEFRIRRVMPAFIDTPVIQSSGYQSSGVGGGIPSKWLRVEVEFDSKPEWADDVEVRWYLLVGSEKEPVVFADSVMLINVARSTARRHLTVMYVPPRTVDRYSMTSKIKEIAVQIWHNQKLMDTGGWRSAPKERWWEQYSPRRGSMLNLLQTPFGVLDYDKYEQIKVSAAP